MTAVEDDRGRLAELVRELGVVRERVTLSSGATSDYYVDMRRVTLDHRAAPLIGRLSQKRVQHRLLLPGLSNRRLKRNPT